MPLRILYLSPRQSWPPRSGARLRDYHLARALGLHAEVTYLYFAEADAPADTKEHLSFCRKVVAVPKPDFYTPAKLIRGAIGRQPLSVVNYTSAAMMDALSKVLEGPEFDLVHLDSIHMFNYVARLRPAERARVVYDWHNIESEIMFRFGKNVASVPKKLYATLTAKRLAAMELDILRNAFGHVVCSPREKEQLLVLTPKARIEVIGNGVEVDAFSPAASDAKRNRILFVGSMAYHANIEGAVWFVQKIWPEIQQRYPEWRLTLVGSDPAPAVLELRKVPNVEVTGTVPDVKPYYQEALAAIVPLLVGGGTRLKILEAMAAGVPVVSTALGAEGLEVANGENILIAANDQDWMRHLSSLTGPLRQSLTAAGRALVRKQYDWNAIGQELYQTYVRWLAGVNR